MLPCKVLIKENMVRVMMLQMEMRKLTEESQCLRELLARSRDELERERRINEAIKQKKVIDSVLLLYLPDITTPVFRRCSMRHGTNLLLVYRCAFCY